MTLVLSVILPILAKSAGALLATLGALAFNQLRAYLAKKTHNETIDSTLARLQSLVVTTVEGLEQTTVSSLRDADGKLDESTAKLMRQRVLDKLNELYGADGIDRLATDLKTSKDAVISLIGMLLEQAVIRYKQAHGGTSVIVEQPAPATLPDFGGLRPGEMADNGVRAPLAPAPASGGSHIDG